MVKQIMGKYYEFKSIKEDKEVSSNLYYNELTKELTSSLKMYKTFQKYIKDRGNSSDKLKDKLYEQLENNCLIGDNKIEGKGQYPYKMYLRIKAGKGIEKILDKYIEDESKKGLTKEDLNFDLSNIKLLHEIENNRLSDKEFNKLSLENQSKYVTNYHLLGKVLDSLNEKDKNMVNVIRDTNGESIYKGKGKISLTISNLGEYFESGKWERYYTIVYNLYGTDGNVEFQGKEIKIKEYTLKHELISIIEKQIKQLGG